MRTHPLPTPALDALKAIVAGMAEPFTLNDAMRLSGIPESSARGHLMSMKSRGWIEPRARSGRNGQKYWTRTRYFGVDKSRAREEQQRAALALLGQCLAAWRTA